jgi:hypothetical protein
LKKKGDYEIGEILTCRKYTKLKGKVCNVNFEYTIKDITTDFIIVEDISYVRIPHNKLQYVKSNYEVIKDK